MNNKKLKYIALHNWIRKRLRQPKKCQHCNKIKKLDLANKSGKYNQDLSDWLWLCRSCHVKYDYTEEREIRRLNSRKGYRHSDQTKEKMSIAQIGKSRPYLIGNTNGFKKGEPMSNEMKKFLSMKFSGKGNPFYGKKHTIETLKKLKTGIFINCSICNKVKYKSKSRAYQKTCSKKCGYIQRSLTIINNNNQKYA